MDYIKELIKRLSTKSTGAEARLIKESVQEELRQVRDLTFIAQIELLSAEKFSAAKYALLCEIATHIFINTKDPRALELYRALWIKALQEGNVKALQVLMRQAAPSKESSLKDLVVRSLALPGGMFSEDAISYYTEVLPQEAVTLIGNMLDNDYGEVLAFSSAIALGQLGDAAALPYLNRAIKRHSKGRKLWQQDIVGYAKSSIQEIQWAKDSSTAPLSVACANQMSIEELRARNLNVIEPPRCGPILTLTISARDEATVFKLLEAGADPNIPDQYGNTALHMAASSNQFTLIPRLIESGASIEARNQSKMTPFICACGNGAIQAMDALLHARANIEALTSSSDTGLICAAKGGRIEVIQWLINKGANLHAVGSNNRTALDWAEFNHRLECAELLKVAMFGS